MSALPLVLESPHFAFSSQAVSEESDAVEALQQCSEEQIRNSVTYGDTFNSITEELVEIFEESSTPDWDGHGSGPLKIDAVINAALFAAVLPHYIPLPELTPTSRGEVDFDWSFGDRKLLNVSITETGMLIYAYSNELETRHGSLPFTGELPDAIVEIFRQVNV